ncbi:MAG TPA: EamA family transporter, partial [Candidatus Saccharimonadia bacterium]|nr:EamA family transporter [Candidatus Saccharimonadia bacterium]
MWLIPSLINALTQGFQNAYFKKMAPGVSPYLMVWSVLVISSICFAPLLLFGIPHLGPNFWTAVILRLIVDSVAFTLFVAGVQRSPLTLTVPMMSLTPLFSIVTTSIINHLAPSLLGIAGICVVCAGVYMLNFDHDTKHILSPLRAILRERGVLFVAIASILWSVVIGLQKLGIDNSSV